MCDMWSIFQGWESLEVSIREKPKTANLRKTAECLMNVVHTRLLN